MVKFPHVAAVIRTEGDETSAVSAVIRAIKNGVGLVLLLVHGASRSEAISRLLKANEYVSARADRYLLLKVKYDCGVASALNIAFSRINLMAKISSSEKHLGFSQVFIVSPDLKWESDHLGAMCAQLKDDPDLFVIGSRFDAYQDKPSHKVVLGDTYGYPRNTCCLYRTSILQELHGFDPICDVNDGQEDLDFLLRMGIFHHGVRWGMVESQIPFPVTEWNSEKDLDSARQTVQYYHDNFLLTIDLRGRLAHALNHPNFKFLVPT